jgi:PAS domain S-box-containing protein
MNLDIRTLVFILGSIQLLQILVFALQAVTNPHHQGNRWWLLWSATSALGLAFLLLRDLPSFVPYAIILQNVLLTLSILFLATGIHSFLGISMSRKILAVFWGLFLPILVVFTFIHVDYSVRIILLSFTWSFIAFMVMGSLWSRRRGPMQVSLLFLAAVFLIHGLYFLLRGAIAILHLDIDGIFEGGLYNVSAYLEGIAASVLLTSGIIIMINQRARAELSETKTRYEHLFSTSPDAALLTRLDDGRIVHANDAFCALSGYGPEEAIGRTVGELGVWGEAEARLAMVEELRARGRCENVEILFRHRGGELSTVLFSAKVFPLNGVPHIISMARDITERKRIEDEKKSLLAQAQIEQDRLKAVLENIPDEVWFADSRGVFTLANPTASREFKLEPGETIGVKHLAESLEVLRPDGSPRPLEEAPPLRALAGEIVKNQEEIVRTPATGDQRYRQVSSMPVKDRQGRIMGSVSVVRDITALKKSQVELQENLGELRKWQAVMLDREDRIQELKAEANALCRSLGEPARYFEPEAPASPAAAPQAPR